MKPDKLKISFVLGVVLFIFLSSINSVVCSLENSNYTEIKHVEYKDDIPPFIEIIYPESGFIYLSLFGKDFKIPIPLDVAIINPFKNPIFVIVNATDNIGVELVEFYLNGMLRDIDYEPPYVMILDVNPMFLIYEVRAVARDFAGNEASDTITIWRSSPFPLNS